MGRTDLRIAGRYRLVERLGNGGMSVVWRAYDETLGRAVAVKVLSPRLADDQQFRDRLRQEALAAARLCHPHVTGVFDFGESPLNEHLTVPYVVMELHDGETVTARLNRSGPLPWREAVTIAAEVASALATAHARGLVHRDVTPANVMLTGVGAKVVDFGISAIVGQRDSAPDGSLLGTPAYLAPERLSGAQVTPATDVYALGLLLYRSLTGRLPWPAETTAEALRAHLYADPAPLPALAGMPESAGALCLSCLAKAPAGRPSAATVARELGGLVGLLPVIPATAVGSAFSAPPTPDPPTAASPSFLPIEPTIPCDPFSPSSRSLPSSPSSQLEPSSIAASVSLLGSRVLRPEVARRPHSLRLRAGLKVGSALRLGVARPLGGGLFAGGNYARALLGLFAVRRRTRAVLLTFVVLILAGLVWSAGRPTPVVQQAEAAGAAAGDIASCSVRYQLKSDSGSDYEAQLTVATTDDVGREPWRVQFSYPGTQRLTGVPKAVTQHGRKVVVKGRGKLKSYTLRGAYRGTNPLPLTFTLNGTHCQTEILGSASVKTAKKRKKNPHPIVSRTPSATPSSSTAPFVYSAAGPVTPGPA